MLQTDYNSLSDAGLIVLADKDEQACSELVSRYLGMVRRIAHLYSNNHSDWDDFISEGNIALLNAIKTFDGSRGASFSTYAYACVNNRMLTALKKSNRIINCEEAIDDFALDPANSPENIVINREELGELRSYLDKALSKTEKKVFDLYVLGLAYQAIADKLGISLKAVDNALMRVRRKLRSQLR